MKILLVDDTKLFLELGLSYLDRETFEVSTANSGQEALDSIDRSRPDLVIMDLHMPGMEGDAVCREIKSDPDKRRIPVIMLSSSSETGVEKRCLGAGADAFVPKPIKRDELLGAIEKVAVIAKRRFPRVPTHIMCTISDQDREDSGYITSISEGGLFIEADRTPETGRVVGISFTIAGLGREISCRSTVRWRGSFRPDAPPGIGVQFLSISGEDRQAIGDHVEDRLKSLLQSHLS
jgi:uncharacterized protein (TIGR02266 family)